MKDKPNLENSDLLKLFLFVMAGFGFKRFNRFGGFGFNRFNSFGECLSPGTPYTGKEDSIVIIKKKVHA